MQLLTSGLFEAELILETSVCLKHAIGEASHEDKIVSTAYPLRKLSS